MTRILGSNFPASRRRVWWEQLKERFHQSRFYPWIIW